MPNIGAGGDYVHEDIKPKWYSLIRRLQSVSKSEGLSIIGINILVNKDGEPLFWTEPKKTLVEPKNASNKIISLLTDFDNVDKIF